MKRAPKNTARTKESAAPIKMGRPRAYTPEALYAVFEEYVASVKNHPAKINKVSAGEVIPVPTERPLLVVGFCVYAGITTDTFYRYADIEEFSGIITRIREEIESDQVAGAMLDVYSPNIVARLVGLVDRKDVTTDGKAMQAIATPVQVTLDAEAARIIQSIGSTTEKA